jgi:citrate lyase subunit beta/citryl-CoA lyase
MLAKAAGLPADEVVVDLEDGVAVADKESARANLAAAHARGTLAVRINGVRTPWWRDDLAAAAHADVIVVPKVESPEDVAAVGALVPAGAGASEYALARIAVAARAFGLQPVDGPYAVLADTEGLAESARRALAHGYDGKWVIHPDQIEPVNDAFTPSAAEIERARAIVAAADGASRLDGDMVDAATKRLAESVLARGALFTTGPSG